MMQEYNVADGAAQSINGFYLKWILCVKCRSVSQYDYNNDIRLNIRMFPGGLPSDTEVLAPLFPMLWITNPIWFVAHLFAVSRSTQPAKHYHSTSTIELSVSFCNCLSEWMRILLYSSIHLGVSICIVHTHTHIQYPVLRSYAA